MNCILPTVLLHSQSLTTDSEWKIDSKLLAIRNEELDERVEEESLHYFRPM
jgi:hypothetical protein